MEVTPCDDGIADVPFCCPEEPAPFSRRSWIAFNPTHVSLSFPTTALSPITPEIRRYCNLGLQEIIHPNTGLFQNRSQSAFGDVAWVIRNRRVAIRAGVMPNLMAASGLPIELEAAQP